MTYVKTNIAGEKGGVGGVGFLTVGADASELNAHTYVYQPEKDLQGFTIEALPSADQYEPKADQRPTLDELMVGKVRSTCQPHLTCLCKAGGEGKSGG